MRYAAGRHGGGCVLLRFPEIGLSARELLKNTTFGILITQKAVDLPFSFP
jgi:hypothetical protein